MAKTITSRKAQSTLVDTRHEQEMSAFVAQQWKPGQSGNPNGRPKGSKTKLSEAFVAALCVDWAQHGQDVIQKVRDEDPAAYMRVIASLVPKDLVVREASLEEMSDEELAENLALLKQFAKHLEVMTPQSERRGRRAVN